MKVTNKRGDRAKFREIIPGGVFQNEYRDTYIKMSETVILLEDGTTCKANAIYPETGELARFEDGDVVYSVEAELVIL